MSPRDEALRLTRAHLAAAVVLLDALLMEPAAAGEPEDEPVPATCPGCNEAREDKLEETNFTGEDGVIVPRVTCLSCGRSFSPEVSRG